MTQELHSKWIKRAAVASVAVSTLLLLAKIAAWMISDSTSVLSSLLDSMVDIAASLVNLIAVRYALMPADEDHHFGHDKAEGIAALIQSAFILGTALLLLLQVIGRILQPQPVGALEESIGIMLFSAAVSGALVLFQRAVARKTGSLAIRADSAHYTSDIWTSLVVVVALVCSGMGYYWVDPLVALIIVVVLLHGVGGIAKQALVVLLDQALDPVIEARIRALVLSVDGVRGVHDLQTRQAIRSVFIQMHIELDGQQSLSAAHQITVAALNKLLAEFPQAQIIIHQDPV